MEARLGLASISNVNKQKPIKPMAPHCTQHLTTKRTIARYGWNPDLPDHRGFCLQRATPQTRPLPAKADLRKQCPAVYDQGQIVLTANAIAAAIEFDLLKQSSPISRPHAFLHLLQRARYRTHRLHR